MPEPKMTKSLLLPVELTDGEHRFALTPDQVGTDLASAVHGWLEAAEHGDQVTLRCVVMTEQELEALPTA